MEECKYLLTFIASNKNNKNTSVIQFFIFTIAHNTASDIICKMEYNKVILTIAYKNKKVPAWDFLMKINFLYFPYQPCLTRFS